MGKNIAPHYHEGFQSPLHERAITPRALHGRKNLQVKIDKEIEE